MYTARHSFKFVMQHLVFLLKKINKCTGLKQSRIMYGHNLTETLNSSTKCFKQTLMYI